MNAINEDVIKAREVVAGYKKFNKQTIEKLSSYDPVFKIWTFIKKDIDPNAAQFKKEFIKSGRKEKKDIKIQKSHKKIKPTALSKIKKPRILKSYKPRVKPSSHLDFDQTSLIAKAYNYHLQGKTNKEVSFLMDMPMRAIISMLRKRDRQLGVEIEKNDNYERIVQMIKSGKTRREISKLIKMSEHNISYHIKRYNDSKSKEQIEKEYQEILYNIKKKAKLNQVEYCYSSWINPSKCKMKSNLTIPVINKRCKDLIKQGRLTEIDGGVYRRMGVKYQIPKK